MVYIKLKCDILGCVKDVVLVFWYGFMFSFIWMYIQYLGMYLLKWMYIYVYILDIYFVICIFIVKYRYVQYKKNIYYDLELCR